MTTTNTRFAAVVEEKVSSSGHHYFLADIAVHAPHAWITEAIKALAVQIDTGRPTVTLDGISSFQVRIDAYDPEVAIAAANAIGEAVLAVIKVREA